MEDEKEEDTTSKSKYSTPNPMQTRSSVDSTQHSFCNNINDQPNLTRMLNPSVFFNSVRNSKKRKGVSPLSGKGYDSRISTPLMTLHQAARDGQLDVVQHYIKNSKDRKKLNKKDKENSTALHYAVRYGHHKIVKVLLENGANINVQGECGATPLHYAARATFKTPKHSNFDEQLPTLPSQRKSKGLRQLMSNKRYNTMKKDELHKRKLSPFVPLQRSLRNLLDRSNTSDKIIISPVKYHRQTTIHNSLERLDNEYLLLKHDSDASQTQSNIELQKLSSVGNNFSEESRSKDSSDVSVMETTKLLDDVVAVNTEVTADADAELTLQALMLPNVKDFVPQIDLPLKLKPSKSLPEVYNITTCNPENRLKELQTTEEMIMLYLLEKKANVNATDHYDSTPLHVAASRDNAIAAKHLLNSKSIEIEAKDRTRMTALHCACSHGAIKVCELLLQRDANLRSVDEEDMTPLHFAAMEGHTDIVNLLFEHGDKSGGYTMLAKMIMDQDRDEQTALHLAVENGHADIVKMCVAKGANVNFVKANMITPLHLACTSGQTDIVQFLVENEADIGAKNVLQETPLHRAALFNKIDIITYLLDRGAEIDCRDKDKETPLMMAIRKNNVEAVRLLVSRGANVSLKEVADKTCLYIAAEDDCIEVLQILQEVPKIGLLLEDFDENENTPLHVAASKGHIKIVEQLLEMGAQVDGKNGQDLTPLHLAAKFGRSRIVKFLLEKRANLVNDEDDCSNTPLHLASLEGHVTVVSLLLEHGADVDARNAMLWTPLDCAASRGWTWCVECLLDADAQISPTDKTKTTPLHLASKEGHADVIQLLIDRKADIAGRDHMGRNCLDFAIENNQKGAAITILNSEHWRSALRNSTVEGNKVTTPMRKLIKKLPGVAELVFDKCIHGNDLPVEHPSYKVNCCYEFLEDRFTEWGPYHCKGMVEPSHNDVNVADVPQANSSLIAKIGRKLKIPGCVKQRAEGIRNHVLKQMVRNERTKLLSHPLVTYLLRHKWRSVGRYIYYSKLLLYIIYLMFITGYALTDIADKYQCVGNTSNSGENCSCKLVNNNSYQPTPSPISRKLFIHFGRYAIIFLAGISLLIQFVKFVLQFHHFISCHNIVECFTYSLAVIFVMKGTRFELMKNSRCNNWHQSLGALTVWLSWINLVLFMRRFPKMGIYVVMFTDILQTFAQFFMVFALFIIAFGLGFHMLLYEQEPFAFTTPLRAMLKTTMGMLGEFEYDTVFNDKYTPVPMAWMIYVAYLVVCCIILMNLLVGLAVDDIKEVQKQAALQRLAMQVDLALDVEKVLPQSMQKRLVKMEEDILPNAVKGWSLWSFWSVNSSKSSYSEKKKTFAEPTALENILSLKNKVRTLEAQNNRLEVMMEALIQYHGIQLKTEPGTISKR